MEELFFDIYGNILSEEILASLSNGKGVDEVIKGAQGDETKDVVKMSPKRNFTNSPLVSFTLLSPNYNPRNRDIDTITIHCMAGNLSVETCGRVFYPVKRQASSNYGVGTDGRIGMYCEEKNRSWCSSSPANDHRAITIEVANDTLAPDYHVSDKAMEALIALCADICRRNEIKHLYWVDDKNKRINHLDGANMTWHRDFAATACPGPYLMSKHPYIAQKVNDMIDPPTVLKGVCQMPNPNGPGFLLGIEVKEDHGYTGEISIYDCSQQAWIAGTGKCYLDNNTLWWTWTPQYGYYWTLFRVWDGDKVIAEQCYGFQNI